MSDRRLCVLFAGNAGAGKDTGANMLAEVCKEHGISTARMAFADPIKEAAAHLFGIPIDISYGSQSEKLSYEVYGKSARHWLQWLGTEVGREQIHTDIWVHRFVERALNSGSRVVIGSDCRFRNEMVLVREMLGDEMDLTIVKIVNPRIPVDLKHQSESEVYNIPDSEFDLVIDNSSNLQNLLGHIENLARVPLGLLS